jgi:hypothetical protein
MNGRRLYHYTALDHAEEIVRSGVISRGGIPLPDASGEHLDPVERGWQWLTTSDDWAQGWAARAHRLAEEFPDSPVHGWMAWMQGLVAWLQSDFDAAIHTNADLVAAIRNRKGVAKVNET